MLDYSIQTFNILYIETIFDESRTIDHTNIFRVSGLRRTRPARRVPGVVSRLYRATPSRGSTTHQDMSRTDEPAQEPEDGPRSALPCFALSYRFDTPHDPRSVTVYDPSAADVATTWLSADAAVAVSLDEIA